MNKNLLVGAIIGALVLVAGIFVVGSDDTAEVSNNNNSIAVESSIEKDTELAENTNTNSSGDNYIEFSEQALADSSGTKRVVFFHAGWCSTCNFFEKQIESSGVPDEITILKADYDRDTDLKNRYGVKVQSTFVLLDANGEVERTWPFASGLSGIQDLYTAII